MNVTSEQSPQRESPRLERFIRRRELLLLTGLPNSTIYEMMAKGTFPKNVRISPRLVGWKESDIIAWQQTRKPRK